MSPRLSLDQALAAPAETLALDMISADHLAPYIPETARPTWASAALDWGRALAAEAQDRHGAIPVREAAAASGAEVRVDPSPARGAVLMVSTYTHRPPTITIYPSTIERLRDQVLALGLERELPDLESIAVAHELFHHLDQTRDGSRTRGRFRVTLARLGPWRREATVLRAAEVGAHAFAQSFLSLPRFPGILEYLALARKP